MNAIDIYLTSAVNSLAGSTRLLDILMISITYFGVPCMVVWTTLQWWTGNDRSSRRHVIVSAGLSFLLGLLINQLILLFIHRLRPYDAGLTSLLIPSTTDPSFPSDHATASFAICFAFLVKGLKRMGIAMAVMASLICLSRVYVGTHYVTDVLGGMLTALIATLLVARVYRPGSRWDTLLTSVL